MNRLLLRHATIVALVLMGGAAWAQGGGRHAAGRGGAMASPSGLAYGAGYQARQRLLAERERQLAAQATQKPAGECAVVAAPSRDAGPARARDPGPGPAPEPERRDACVATRP